LCGPLLRQFAKHLTGVDLSHKMLERAAERAVYDRLDHGELNDYLSTNPDRFDAIVSADTLVYFGDLAAIAKAAGTALREGGLFVFTLEKAPDDQAIDYSIGTHGRYCHKAGYIRGVLEAAGFEVTSMDSAVLRRESGAPVDGLVTTAVKRT
jgi:predicted TPR repeat methyltransferase